MSREKANPPADPVEEARALLAEATPADRWTTDWYDAPLYRDGWREATFAIGPQHGRPQFRVTNPEAYDAAGAARNADRALIAAAPRLLGALVEEVTKARQEAASARALLAEAHEALAWEARTDSSKADLVGRIADFFGVSR
jgi:hypothetical protein